MGLSTNSPERAVEIQRTLGADFLWHLMNVLHGQLAMGIQESMEYHRLVIAFLDATIADCPYGHEQAIFAYVQVELSRSPQQSCKP